MSPASRPVIVLGAARSGTKILRDSLATALGCAAVPYDISYVWRHGNESAPDDVLPASAATSGTRRFVHRFLAKYADRSGLVVEKTVGNTLRVPYVDAIVPGARYVHIVRDGVDVAESARRQWSASPDLHYLLGKARHFPLRLVPTYGVRFVADQTWRRRGHSGHAASWGPRYPGIDDDVATLSLLEVCARQWRESVSFSRDGLRQTGAFVVGVRFEELASRPEETLRRVVGALDETVDDRRLGAAAQQIRPTTVGAGRSRLTAEELSLMDAEIGEMTEELGYERPR